VLADLSKAFAPEENWVAHSRAGTAAFQRGDFLEAEKHFLIAVQEAERLG